MRKAGVILPIVSGNVMRRVREHEGGRAPLNIGMEQAMKKARHFCAYQERSHGEVREKLYGFGLRTEEVDETMSVLISENYLNEERFAVAFAGGKFRMKQWGRQKIRHALKSKGISEYCIRTGMRAIDDDQYMEVLNKLFQAKKKSLSSEKNMFIKKAKIRQHLLQKGFESDLVDDLLRTGRP